jgi:MFS family permease
LHTNPYIKKRYFNHPTVVAIFAAAAVFLTYGTVYAFRKPFTVATFDGLSFLGISYKVCLVITQLAGYVCSKFYGIKFISELKKIGRWKMILVLVGISWFSLLFFAVVPPPFNIPFLFLNGFPLGIIWGIIFSYIEGRRATDFIGAALAVSFIFSSGFVKSVAKYLMLHWNVSEFWLPFTTGLVFILPLLVFIFLLEKIPAPTPADIQLRHVRNPMTKDERKKLIADFLPGILLLVIIYIFLTIFRDMRDNFAADIWNELGFSDQAAIFTQTEIPVTIIVLILIASLVFIKRNFNAFIIAHGLILLGFVLSGVSTWLFLKQAVHPPSWMILVGIGLYMAYIPFNCMLFERMIAAFRINGNVGFLMYCADSFGYLGSMLVLLGKEVFHIQLHWVSFFSNGVIGFSIFGVIATIFSAMYFLKKHKKSFTLWNNVQPSLSAQVL